jgi:hypothetical protein
MISERRSRETESVIRLQLIFREDGSQVGNGCGSETQALTFLSEELALL